MNYRVWGEYRVGDALGSREIEAATAADAAERWAEERDAENPDPYIEDSQPATVYVRAFGDMQPRRFTVTAEKHYTYRAQIAATTKGTA